MVDSCGIYIIKSPSGKAYVGSSRRLPFRRTRHFYELRQKTHHCEPLQRAWNKYEGNLQFHIIENCNENERNDREQFWIDNWRFFCTGLYNSKLTIDPTAPLSEQTKKKISAVLSGRILTEDHKRNMRKPKSSAHAEAISRGKKGRKNKPWSDDAKKQRVDLMVEKWKSRDRDEASRLVKQAWQPGGYLYKARMRPKLDAHMDMLNWIVQSEPVRHKDLFDGLPNATRLP